MVITSAVWRETRPWGALNLILKMSSELVATYSGLGTKDGEEYYKGQECLGKLIFLSSL